MPRVLQARRGTFVFAAAHAADRTTFPLLGPHIKRFWQAKIRKIA